MVSLGEGLIGSDGSVRRRNHPNSQGDTSVGVETSLAGASGSVAIEVDVQQHRDTMDDGEDGRPTLMSSPVDLLSTLPVELGPLDIDVDSFAWSQNMSEKSVHELRASIDEIRSPGEERSPTPGSAAALRKKRAAQRISASAQTPDPQPEETSPSPEVLEPDSLSELRRTLDKLEQKRMRRRRRSNDEEDSPSYSPPDEISSPVSAESPTFGLNVKQFGPQRPRSSGSGPPRRSTPEEPRISSVRSSRRSVRHSPASSYPPVWARFGHSLTDIPGHQTEDSVSHSPVVPSFSWSQNPRGLYRSRSESFGQEPYIGGDNVHERQWSHMQPPIYGAASDMEVQPSQPRFRWDERRAVGQKRIEDGQVFTYVAPGEMETEV